MKLRRERRRKMEDLKVRWHQHLIDTKTPFVENIVLFWHNHFVTSAQKVRVPTLLLNQQIMFREHLTSPATLVGKVVRDPAMLVYLDNRKNRKRSPNENLGRELLELFTLGEGNYSERDIKEAARALTGNTVDKDTGTFRHVPRRHDDEQKSILGNRGNFDGDSLAKLLVGQPAFANLLAAKVWNHFVGDAPRPIVTNTLAKNFRASGLDFKVLLRDVLMHPGFWDAKATAIKSPVMFSVGLVRNLGIEVTDVKNVAKFNRRLGQDLFQPPNVRGWVGGNSWLNTTRLLVRHELVDRALNSKSDALAGTGEWADVKTTELKTFLLPIEPTRSIPTQRRSETLRALLLDPTFQLA